MESLRKILDDPNTLIMVAIVVVATILLLRTRRYFTNKSSRSSAYTPPRESQDRHATGYGTASELNRWEVQMHETARELMAQLDSKMRALQALIHDADRAAARLEAAKQPSPSTPEKPINPRATLAFPANQAEGLRSPSASNEGRAVAQQKKDEIYTLADYGYKASEIAQRLSLPIGEVDLILSLRPNQ